MEKTRDNEKLKHFLRWKWGYDNPDSNFVLEKTRQNNLYTLLNGGGLSKLKPDARKFWQGVIDFENECNDKRKRLNLPLTSAVGHFLADF